MLGFWRACAVLKVREFDDVVRNWAEANRMLPLPNFKGNDARTLRELRVRVVLVKLHGDDVQVIVKREIEADNGTDVGSNCGDRRAFLRGSVGATWTSLSQNVSAATSSPARAVVGVVEWPQGRDAVRAN